MTYINHNYITIVLDLRLHFAKTLDELDIKILESMINRKMK